MICRDRTGARRPLTALVSCIPLVIALFAPALLTAPASAAPAPKATPNAVTGSLPSDESIHLPLTAHDETVGDFLSRGYDQRAVIQDGKLNIYDSPTHGGTLLRSTPTDLVAPSQSTYSQWDTQFVTPATTYRLSTIYLLWTPDALYMAGATGVGNDTSYKVKLYKLPPDGTCASAGCAIWVKSDIPNAGIANLSRPLINGITSMAVGRSGANTLLAVGTSTSNYYNGSPLQPSLAAGVISIDAATGTTIDTFGGFQRGAAQSPVTSLAWDPKGSGLLGIGALNVSVGNPARPLHAVHLTSAGKFEAASYTHYEIDKADASLLPLSMTILNRADGSPLVAAGLANSTVDLWDPAATSATLVAKLPSALNTDPVDALSGAVRIDGTTGLADLVAVSSNGDSARVLRYTGGTTLAPQPVQAGGRTETDIGGIRDWFPGYKAGRVRVMNRANLALNVSFASRPNAAYGCWFAPSFPGRAAFPSGTVPVAARTTTEFYTIGGLTAGVGGDCAATDLTGQWAAYVTIEPVQQPADRTVAKLELTRTGDLKVTAVGGSLTLRAEVERRSLPMGTWRLVIDSPQPNPPVPAGGIIVSGKRLDPAGAARPVYRFDVAATTWDLPYRNPPRIAVALPPMVVQGSADRGSTWHDEGLLVPQGQPTRTTNGSVTLAPVSFYWQNPDASPLTDIRVVVGVVRSNPVRISNIPAPPAATIPGQLAVCPASGNSTCDADAAPFANGMDQAPLKIQIYDSTSTNVLPVSDPLYQRVYYTDENGELLTGLLPEDGSPYTRVSPYPGEYSNDGSAGSIVRPSPTAPVGGRFGYLSTTSTNEQDITAHVAGTDVVSAAITVRARQLAPQVPAGSQASTGFYVSGCSDYSGTPYCQLAAPVPTKPVVYLTHDPNTGGLLIGLLFRAVGANSLAGLPLQQVAGQPEHSVNAALLNVNNGEVSLDSTSAFQPGDDIDIYLVTHGTLFPARSVQVGGGN